jgi:nickel-dependent lactate racemase
MAESVPRLQPKRGKTDAPAALQAAIEQTARALPDGKGVTLLLNDPQRRTRSDVVLGRLAEPLAGRAVRVLVAAGTHRFDTATRRAFEAAVCSHIAPADVAWHDCRAPDLVAFDGANPWRCHHWLTDDDWALLAVGSCEPHYFAGITGAHKTCTIGCAAFGDIQRNHAGALSPESRPVRLAGNPVHEGIAAMVAGLSARRDVRAINLLQVGDDVLSAAAGEPLEALAELADSVRDTYVCTIGRPAEALVLSLEGVLGASFYQADKALKNNEWAVRDGGCLVLVAACGDGIGQDAFMGLLRRRGTYDEALAEVNGRGYRLGDHKGLKLRYLTDRRGVRVFVVSDGLSEEDAKALGFTKAGSVEQALATAGIDPAGGGVYEVADAANTCVVVEKP